MKSGWSYGAEHEWADHPRDAKLPAGCVHNTKDTTIVNSSGIANDPTSKLYAFGGEINTPPTNMISGQVELMRKLIKALPTATVNYRSNLHLHIRVPGLRDNLELLKRVQLYIHVNMPKAFPIIEPIPAPTAWEYPDEKEFAGAIRRYKRRKVSHQTLLGSKRLGLQLAAKTVKEFFESEVPRDDGRPLWHLQPRLSVNLRQMLDTDTIEFRHWPGTMDARLLSNCFVWCDQFLRAALDKAPFDPLLRWARQTRFPSFPPYIHYLEVRYRATVHDGSIPRANIIKNIALIEAGKFDKYEVVQLEAAE